MHQLSFATHFVPHFSTTPKSPNSSWPIMLKTVLVGIFLLGLVSPPTQGVTYQLGTMMPLLNSTNVTENTPLFLFTWSQLHAGFSAALKEANDNAVFGAGNDVQLVVQNVFPLLGTGDVPALMAQMPNPLGFALTSYYGIHRTFFASKALRWPIIGGLPPDASLLTQDDIAINYRVPFLTEGRLLLKFAIHRLKSTRFAIVYYDIESIRSLTFELKAWLVENGYPPPTMLPLADLE